MAPTLGTFPDENSLIRLVDTVPAEQQDERIEGRRYLGLHVLARSRVTLVDGAADAPPPTPTEEVGTDLTALTA